ncbi:MAG: hypothetical protein RL266_1639 [Bacteroidota bacterium]|jgi:hypothetical protein
MKISLRLLTIIGLSFCFIDLAAQNSNVSTNEERDAIKEETNAPIRTDFKSDLDYKIAKDNWIKENPEAYQKLKSSKGIPKKENPELEEKHVGENP